MTLKALDSKGFDNFIYILLNLLSKTSIVTYINITLWTSA